MAAPTEEYILIAARCAVLCLGPVYPDQIDHLELHNFKPETIITTLLCWIRLKVEAFERGLSKFQRKNFRQRLKQTVEEAVSILKDNNMVSVGNFVCSLSVSVFLFS